MDASSLPPLLGQSPGFVALLEQASRVAAIDRPALVVGERGTGKELISARLHFLSPRWGGPFVKLNCAALSPELLESELFGHEAGAFTGAVRRHLGRFERADGGTLFLDEIATASARVQEQVLRVVEYGEFERLGGSETLSVDVRLIAATNLDLPAAVAAGRFRADLLDRLAFEVLTVPPLRARPEDIPLLADAFGQAMAAELGRGPFAGFAPAAVERLLAHGWPGNVRELRNVAERSVARAERLDRPLEEIALDPFESPWRPPPPAEAAQSAPTSAPTPAPAPEPLDLVRHLEAEERRLIEAALLRHRHNRRRAAAALGLSYDQLRARLRKLPAGG
ncbi:MAG: phage shock protein operon transcriptional activator [Dongiaceae bacterium]